MVASIDALRGHLGPFPADGVPKFSGMDGFAGSDVVKPIRRSAVALSSSRDQDCSIGQDRRIVLPAREIHWRRLSPLRCGRIQIDDFDNIGRGAVLIAVLGVRIRSAADEDDLADVVRT